MLDKHLIAVCHPVADPENVVIFKSYRVTVLSDRLFRIEKDSALSFTDEATQSVWFRNMPKQSFKATATEDCLTIKTSRVSLVLFEDLDKSYVLMGRRKVAINNEKNLLGTYRTLDVCLGNLYTGQLQKKKLPEYVIQLENGVVSRNGVAVIDDTKSLILKEDGKIYARPETELDIYVFAFGNDYREAVRSLYMITGDVPKIPKYALGNWWSRYYAYTDRSYLHLLDKFDEENIPLTVATIDMDWHYSGDLTPYFDFPEEVLADVEKYGKSTGWTGYSWNTQLFPDYKAFLSKLKERNLKITLNLHPADGIRFFEDQYEDMAKAMGIDPATKVAIPFNVTDDNFINNYFKLLHKPYEHDGVGFWWIDWQQGTTTALAGLDPLWALNHYHYLDNGAEQEPLILSRYSGIGSHRYPLGFSGDTYIAWESLDYIPYFTATASNAGYTWWSHDIGGHMRGIKSDELYLRYIQFGVFSPINRLHSQNHEMNSKEPWEHMGGMGELAKRYLRLRHKMLPFLYSASIKNHKLGDALIEPMYYDYPECAEAYKYTNQYMFGSQLLVAPVTSPAKAKGLAQTTVWLPKGRWTDIFSRDVYEGGRVVRTHRYPEEMPVFAKEGAVFVTSKDNNKNSIDNPTLLAVDIYNGNGSYDLYEDKDGAECVTHFVNTYEDGKQTTAICTDGDKNAVVPSDRVYVLRFPNITSGSVEVVCESGNVSYEYDDNDIVSVTVAGNPDKISVSVSFTPKTELEMVKDMASNSIKKLQAVTNDRMALYNNVIAAASIDEYKNIIATAPIHSIYKKRLLEFVK